MTFRYTATALAAIFTTSMGILYLIALHVEHAPDDLFRQAMFVGLTLLTGSMAIERLGNRNGNGK